MKKKETAKVCCKQKFIKRMYFLSLVEYLPAVKETGVMCTDIRESLGTILQDILIDSVRDIFFSGKNYYTLDAELLEKILQDLPILHFQSKSL